MSFQQLFLRTYVEKKAAKTTFVRKKREKNIDEIDTCLLSTFHHYREFVTNEDTQKISSFIWSGPKKD